MQLHFLDPHTMEDISLTKMWLQAEMVELANQLKPAASGPVVIRGEEQEKTEERTEMFAQPCDLLLLTHDSQRRRCSSVIEIKLKMSVNTEV